jgi:hypothetical protein
LEGRPDLAGYFEACRTLENFVVIRQGGAARRVGTRKIVEVKNSAKDTILLPFIPNVEESYVVELGDIYARFIRDRAQILNTANIVLNGNFPSGIGSWTTAVTGSGVASWDSAAQRASLLVGPAAGTVEYTQSVAVTAGVEYTISIKLFSNVNVSIGSTVGGSDIALLSGGTYPAAGSHALHPDC